MSDPELPAPALKSWYTDHTFDLSTRAIWLNATAELLRVPSSRNIANSSILLDGEPSLIAKLYRELFSWTNTPPLVQSALISSKSDLSDADISPELDAVAAE